MSDICYDLYTEFPPLKFAEINPICTDSTETNIIFLGTVKAATNVDILRLLNIKSVLTLMGNCPFSYSQYDYIAHKTISIYDIEEIDLTTVFNEAFSFIEENLKHGNILIHCQAGISRSPSVLIGYLMWNMKIGFKEAYEIVKKGRKIILPNRGFVKQLKNYENYIKSWGSQ